MKSRSIVLDVDDSDRQDAKNDKITRILVVIVCVCIISDMEILLQIECN